MNKKVNLLVKDWFASKNWNDAMYYGNRFKTLNGVKANETDNKFEIVSETEKALKIKVVECLDTINNNKELWIPKSVVEQMWEVK